MLFTVCGRERHALFEKFRVSVADQLVAFLSKRFRQQVERVFELFRTLFFDFVEEVVLFCLLCLRDISLMPF